MALKNYTTKVSFCCHNRRDDEQNGIETVPVLWESGGTGME